MKRRKSQNLLYPYNLLDKLGLDTKNCTVSAEFLEVFAYELMSANRDKDKKNYHMLMMYYKQGCLLAEIGLEYHISRQAVQVRIQKMINRLCHPTRIRRIAELMDEENQKL